MAIDLDEYRTLHEALPDAAQETLRAAWNEAARCLSPRGLDNYLRGALALHQLGRGEPLVLAYLESAPALVREIGEDILPDLVHGLLAMASKTSGAVLALIAGSTPLAARRLGDEQLFREYLDVLSLMLAQVPRALRPMLEHLEPLLSQLSLGGLRRWVQWGAQAYKADFDGQVRYFALQGADSLAVLQQQRKGTLLVNVQRRLSIYLRAIWGRDVLLRPTSGEAEGEPSLRAYIQDHVVHLADACDDWQPADADPARAVGGVELYRAALNHCAAHLVYTRRPLSMQGLSQLQVALAELIEDARVEALAIERFPNMRESWLALHPRLTQGRPQRVGELLNRLARALLDPRGDDPHPWVRGAVECFAREADLQRRGLARDLAVQLARGLAELELAGYQRRLDGLRAPYRDDNRIVWQAEDLDEQQALQASWRTRQPLRRKVALTEMVNELDCEFAGDDAQEIWVLPTEFYLDQEGVSINSLQGRPPLAEPVHHAEWDYRIQLQRPGWVTVLERQPPLGDAQSIDALLAEHKPVSSRLKRLIEGMVPRGLQRRRHQLDGDDIDLDAAVRLLTQLRIGEQPDPRCMVQLRQVRRDLAVLLLLDLSESSNDKVRGGDYSVLDLARSASVLLAEALQALGDPFAIHGFCSDGRHDVHYYRMKDFAQPWGALAKARLAGMRGSYSTRMGAALRHAGRTLARQPQRRKLCLVVTDGEPADNDVRDPQYLRHDARKAVEELARDGVTTHALSLDPHADGYVSRIFGPRHFSVIDKVERLPEKLPLLYLSLTR